MTEDDFDRLTLVLLRRGEAAGAFAGEELERLQEEHLAYLRALRERGPLTVAGPFGEQSDERLRGLCVYAVGVDEARELAEQDPAVRAGRLAVEVLSWYVERGELSFRSAATRT